MPEENGSKARVLAPLVNAVCKAIERTATAEEAAENAVRAVRRWDIENQYESAKITSEGAATIQNWLLGHNTRLANLMDEIPSLSPIVLHICEATLRLLEDKDVDPRRLQIQTSISADYKYIITELIY